MRFGRQTRLSSTSKPGARASRPHSFLLRTRRPRTEAERQGLSWHTESSGRDVRVPVRGRPARNEKRAELLRPFLCFVDCENQPLGLNAWLEL